MNTTSYFPSHLKVIPCSFLLQAKSKTTETPRRRNRKLKHRGTKVQEMTNYAAIDGHRPTRTEGCQPGSTEQSSDTNKCRPTTTKGHRPTTANEYRPSTTTNGSRPQTASSHKKHGLTRLLNKSTCCQDLHP